MPSEGESRGGAGKLGDEVINFYFGAYLQPEILHLCDDDDGTPPLHFPPIWVRTSPAVVQIGGLPSPLVFADVIGSNWLLFFVDGDPRRLVQKSITSSPLSSFIPRHNTTSALAV